MKQRRAGRHWTALFALLFLGAVSAQADTDSAVNAAVDRLVAADGSDAGGAAAEAGAGESQGEAAADEPKAHLDIYGFIMLDTGYEDGQSHPDWYDVARPTKLPSFENEFGADGEYFAGVRQSRLGFKGYIPSAW